MSIPGVRFSVDPDDLSAGSKGAGGTAVGGGLGNLMVSDVLEHSTPSSKPVPPSVPVPGPSSTGFPLPMRRKERPAAQRRREAAKPQPLPDTLPPVTSGGKWDDGSGHVDFEGAGIGAMNDQWLGSLSERQLEEEREELMGNMSPELLELFMKRVNKAEEQEAQGNGDGSAVAEAPPTIAVNPPRPSSGSAKQEEAEQPDLDPESPEFLSRLHEKYFPDLPVEPSKLAWMKPPPEQDPGDSYSPSLTAVAPSAVRFDFRGGLVAPRTAREIPQHLGLHHHADAPLSAGYTIPELAHLARSSFPAQRCMAFQTLGRIMYRLGIGNYTRRDERGEGNNRDLEDGLWRCLKDGKVLFTLEEAVSGGFGGKGDPHLGVRNYATEALWLWQKGGGNNLADEGDDNPEAEEGS